MSHRVEQVSEHLQQLLGHILTRDVELPPDHLVTVKSVEVSPDLREAKVFVSVLPYDSSEEVMQLLHNQRAHIQQELHKQLTMKYSPILTFVQDHREEQAESIEQLIDKEVAAFSFDDETLD